MSTETDRLEYVDKIVSSIVTQDARTIQSVKDILLWSYYGPEVLSQFGMGCHGWIFRQYRTHVLMTVKAVESGTPLVAFVSGSSTIGCVEQMFDLLFSERLKWQKDKYPWI
jgi:hypothetical protein